MVLGALIVPGDYVEKAEAAIVQLLSAHGMAGAEFKWTKVSKAKSAAYRALVDLHFDVLCPNGVEFFAMAIDTYGLDHRCYNEGDADLGYNKFLYQLLLHRVGKRFGEDERIVVDLDARNTTREPNELQRILNSAMGRELGTFMRPPFSRIAHRDSRTSRLLQLADLLAGAVAWHKNDQDARSEASPAKMDLANHIAARAKRGRLGADTWKSETRLGVWNFALGKRGGAR